MDTLFLCPKNRQAPGGGVTLGHPKPSQPLIKARPSCQHACCAESFRPGWTRWRPKIVISSREPAATQGLNSRGNRDADRKSSPIREEMVGTAFQSGGSEGFPDSQTVTGVVLPAGAPPIRGCGAWAGTESSGVSHTQS